MSWLILLAFGLLVWLTYRLGAELFHPAVGVVAALVVLSRPALERDALLGYQDTAFAVLIVLAVLLEARRPRRGEAVLGLLAVAGLMRPEAWVLGGLYFLWMWPRADTGAARAAARPHRPRAGRLGGHRRDRHRRPAALAARDGRPGRGGRPPPRHRRRALLDRAVLRLQPARAARDRHPGRALLRLALPPPRGDPAARRRRGDDARVHDRAGLRAAADRALRPHPVGAADAVLRARRVRLPHAGDPRRAAAVDVDRDRLRRASRSSSCPGTWGCSPTSSAGSTATARCTPRCATPPTTRPSGARSRSAAAASPPPTTAPIPHLRWWLGTDPGSVGTTFAGASPRADVMLLPRRVPLMRRFYQENFPRTERRRPAGRRSTATGSGAWSRRPACVTRLRA